HHRVRSVFNSNALITGSASYRARAAFVIFHVATARPGGEIFRRCCIGRSHVRTRSAASITIAKYGVQSKALHAVATFVNSSFRMLSGVLSVPRLRLRLLTEIPINS